jgi:hypothetical protein
VLLPSTSAVLNHGYFHNLATASIAVEMTSKARFNKGSSVQNITGGSKRTNAFAGAEGSAFATMASKAPTIVQVIHNGKIVTPVSLLAKHKVAAAPGNTHRGDLEVKETDAGTPNADVGAAPTDDDKNKSTNLLGMKKESVTNNRSRFVYRGGHTF